MNSLPEGWVDTTLGEVTEYINRGITPKYSDVGVTIINQRCIRDGKVVFQDSRLTDPLQRRIPEDKLLQSYDVVVCSTGVGTLGRVSQLKEVTEKLTVDSHVTIVRGSEKTQKQYLGYYLKGHQKHIEHLAEGSTGQTELPRKRLESFPINLPPITEQKAIADMLSSFDEKIELLREQNKILETLAQTIFKEWFVNFNYPAPQPPEGGDGGKPPSGDLGAEMVDSELGEIPKGWRVGSLLEVFDLIGGGAPKTSIDEYWNGGISWYSVVDAPKGSETFLIETEKQISPLGLSKSSTKLLQKGTTIVSARGTVGKLALVGRETAMNQSCYGVKGKDFFGDYYIYFQLKESLNSLKSRVHGAVFDTITQSTFKNIMVPLPDNGVVTSYEERVTPIMEKILNNVFQAQSLSKTRDTLLPKLMSGKISMSLVQRGEVF